MKKNIVYLIIASLVYLTSCTPITYPTKYMKDTNLSIAPNVPFEQTKGNITISIKQLNDFEYEKEIYKQRIEASYYPLLGSNAVNGNIDIIVPLYDKLTPFEITIFNKTEHILKMKDSRIIFVEPGKDEPVFAYDKSILIDKANNLQCFHHLINSVNKSWSIANQTFLKDNLISAMRTTINSISFGNELNKEIIPSMKSSGYIIFDVDPEKVKEGKISLIDIVSETDPAGNPSKRVRFDFNIYKSKNIINQTMI